VLGVDEKSVLVRLLAHGMPGVHIDRRLELLFELDGHLLLERPETPTADFGFDEIQVCADENAGSCAKKLDLSCQMLELTVFASKLTLQVIATRRSDPLLDQSRHIKKHGYFQNMTCNFSGSNRHGYALFRVSGGAYNPERLGRQTGRAGFFDTLFDLARVPFFFL